MREVVFGRLMDILPREAWPHEALSFTPWLAANIDRLAEAVGIPLEITGTEIAVEAFAADILARNTTDRTVVLIENQLEQTNHTHLGQIMTYLAGLQAHTVIWVAPKFREPHLSAIRWLNAHTADGFSFFAVRLRLVRIGDSPYAPIFEVLERPNRWERQLQTVAEEVGEYESLAPQRGEYWQQFDQKFLSNGTISKGRHRFFYLDLQRDLYIVLAISRNRATIWAGSSSYEDPISFKNSFARLAELESGLGSFGNSSKIMGFRRSVTANLMDPTSWTETLTWHYEQLQLYKKLLASP